MASICKYCGAPVEGERCEYCGMPVEAGRDERCDAVEEEKPEEETPEELPAEPEVRCACGRLPMKGDILCEVCIRSKMLDHSFNIVCLYIIVGMSLSCAAAFPGAIIFGVLAILISLFPISARNSLVSRLEKSGGKARSIAIPITIACAVGFLIALGIEKFLRFLIS